MKTQDQCDEWCAKYIYYYQLISYRCSIYTPPEKVRNPLAL